MRVLSIVQMSRCRRAAIAARPLRIRRPGTPDARMMRLVWIRRRGRNRGARGAGEDGGQDKRTGTAPTAKPVCTWGWRGTAAGGRCAVPERQPAEHPGRARAAYEVVRRIAQEMGP